MGYSRGIDEFTTMELLQELKRRQDLRSRELCDYCSRPEDASMCRFPTRHIGDRGTRALAKLGEIDVDVARSNREDAATRNSG